MRVLLTEELMSKGVSEQDIRNMYKALGKVAYMDSVYIGLEEFEGLLREAYMQERERGRRVSLWAGWLDKGVK